MHREFVIFLSSGTDIRVVRDRIEQITENVVNPLLYERGELLRMHVDRWEHLVPQRVDTGHTNDVFVQKALNSDLTVVLLRDRLGPGTREEVEALLEEPIEPAGVAEPLVRPDLSVIRFPPSANALEGDMQEIDDFLKENSNKFVYAGPPDVGDPDSPECWLVLIKVLLAAVLKALSGDKREDFNERR